MRATKGPYVLEGEVRNVVGHQLYCGVIEKRDADGAWRGTICRIQSEDHVGTISREEAEANARLIAQAPALVERVEALLRLFKNLGVDPDATSLRAINDARAVLNAVYGEESES